MISTLQPNFENETVLVAEIADGNNEALDFVIRKYEKIVKGFAKKMFRAYGVYETGIEDDVTQDVLIKFYRNINKFKPDTSTSIKTWLLSITKNEVRNRLKTKMHVSIDSKTSSVLDEENLKKIQDIVFSYKQNFDETINYDQSKFIVIQAVEKLNPPFRETMKALIDGDFEASMEELSIMFEVKEGTIKSRLARAREALSPILEPLKFILTAKTSR